MNNSTPTLKDVFQVTEQTPEQQYSDNWKKFDERIHKEVKGIRWTATLSDIAAKLADLLDIDVLKIFTDSWEKSEELKKTLKESQKSPDDKFELNLTEHSINSKHTPSIELRFNKVTVYTIKFNINVSFTVKGFVLKIHQGKIYEIKSGQCQAEGVVSWEGVELLEKKLTSIDLPTLIKVS
jgi:hypothetical protein